MAELDIAAFLRARLDEREASKDKIHHEDCDSKECRCYSGYPCNCGEPERTAADIAAKRQILNLAYSKCGADSAYADGWDDAALWAVKALALSYVGHPEFREEWK